MGSESNKSRKLLSFVFESRHENFFVILCSFIFGILLHSFIESPVDWHFTLIPTAIFILLCAFLSSKRFQVSFACAAAFAFGILVYSQSFPLLGRGTISEYYESNARIEGVVSKETVLLEDGQRVALDALFVNSEPVNGRVLAEINVFPQVEYGDRISVLASVKEPKISESGFRYDRFLLKDGITATADARSETEIISKQNGSAVKQTVLRIKNRILEAYARNLPEPHASFLGGIVLGARKSLPESLSDAFRATGTSHIVAASGYNVGIVSSILFAFLTRYLFSRRTAFWFMIIGISVYVLIAGADSAIVRAGIMGALVLLSRHLGRGAHVRNLFAFTACAMLIVNPRLLVDDVGFELSFLATAALIYLVPKIEERFEFLPEAFALRESFVSSIAATAFTLPLIVFRFGTISLISPIANLFILPFVPYAMIFSPLAMIDPIFSAPAWACLDAMLKFVSLFSSVPFASITL